MHDVKETIKALSSLLASPDEGRRTRLINAIARESIPGKIRLLGNQVIAVGLSIDRWTVDGECAGLVFVNKDDQPMVWQLELGCQAGPADLPMTVTLDDGLEQTEISITEAGSQRVDLLPIAPRSERLVIVATDRTWSPGTHDERMLGVNVDVTPTGTLETLLQTPDKQVRGKLRDEIAREAFAGKMRLLGNQIVAAGLSLDHWTMGGVPAALVFTNYDDREVAPQLVFSCHAGEDELPVTVIIEDGQRLREYLFEEPGSRQIALSAVSPHTKRLYIVSSDKTWSPGPGDPRRLGVGINISPEWTLRSLQQKPDAYIRVKLAEVIANEAFADKQLLLGDFIVAVGLTGDHWTSGDEPAALVVTNTMDQQVVPQLSLTCNASAEELPITVTMDDGQQKKSYELQQPGSMQISLSPVPHHSRRLYMFTTDRTWSPGAGDDRQLGVRLDVAPLGMLASLSDRADPKVWGKLAAAMAQSRPAGATELADGQALLLGTSPDGWTSDGAAAGLVIENSGDHEQVWELSLGCHAGPEQLPITATLEDGQGKQQLVFTEPGSQQLVLTAVQPGCSTLQLISSDRSWSPGDGDDRQLGVLVHQLRRSLDGTLQSLLQQGHEPTRRWAAEKIAEEPAKMAMEDDRVVAVGLTGDQWTHDDRPAGLLISHPEGQRDLVLDLNLTCHASPQELPITAVVEDGEDKKEVRFQEAGSRLVTLAAVPVGQQRLFIISTDKSWSPGTETDDRQLGVRISVEG